MGENGSLTDISLSLLPISPLIRRGNTKDGVHARMYKHANSCTPTRSLKRVKNLPAARIDYLPAVSAQVSDAEKAGKNQLDVHVRSARKGDGLLVKKNKKGTVTVTVCGRANCYLAEQNRED